MMAFWAILKGLGHYVWGSGRDATVFLVECRLSIRRTLSIPFRSTNLTVQGIWHEASNKSFDSIPVYLIPEHSVPQMPRGTIEYAPSDNIGSRRKKDDPPHEEPLPYNVMPQA